MGWKKDLWKKVKKVAKPVGIFVGKAIINAVIEKGEKIVTQKPKDAPTAVPKTRND